MIIFVILAVDTRANSALLHYTGNRNGRVVYYGDEDIPVVLEKEILTFKIFDVPDIFTSEEELKTYDSHIEVEYSFNNPSAEDISMRLLFPIGNIPPYYLAEEFNLNDLDDHGVYIDGKKVCTELRYSFDFDPYNYEEEDLAVFSDEPLRDDRYKIDENSLVTRYTYHLKDEGEGDISAASFAITKTDDRIIYINGLNKVSAEDDMMEAGVFIDDHEDVIDVYVIGEPLKMLKWQFYDDLSCDRTIPGSAELIEVKEDTFWSMIQAEKNTDMRDVDWYNYCFGMMMYQVDASGNIVSDLFMDNGQNYMMRWYDYTLDIKAGSSVVNKISVPIYPDKDMSYDEDVYTYHYLLSPAEAWADVRSLMIDIKTDMYLVFDDEGYTKTDDGYTISYDHLKDGELSFSLSDVSDPKSTAELYDIEPFLIGGIVVVIGIILFVVKRKK